MVGPKPGDVLTAEQARNLPDGAVVDATFRLTLAKENTRSRVTAALLARDLADDSDCKSEVTLVSLPTPPDMAPGSVVLDDRGRTVFRFTNCWREVTAGIVGALFDWSDLAPRVTRVLHDAANPEGGAA